MLKKMTKKEAQVFVDDVIERIQKYPIAGYITDEEEPYQINTIKFLDLALKLKRNLKLGIIKHKDIDCLVLLNEFIVDDSSKEQFIRVP